MSTLIYYVFPILALGIFVNSLRVAGLEAQTEAKLLQLKNSVLKDYCRSTAGNGSHPDILIFLDNCLESLHTINIWYMIFQPTSGRAGVARKGGQWSPFELEFMDAGAMIMVTYVAKKSLAGCLAFYAFSAVQHLFRTPRYAENLKASLYQAIFRAEGCQLA